jgi:hypothetical protein
VFISEQEARYRDYRIMRHLAECEGRNRSPAAKEFEKETKDHGVLECEMLVLMLDGRMVPRMYATSNVMSKRLCLAVGDQNMKQKILLRVGLNHQPPD